MSRQTIHVGLLFVLLLTVFLCPAASIRDKALLTINGPAGMVVQHEGRELGSVPLKLRLTPGSYIFKYSAPGYEPHWSALELKSGVSRKLDVTLTPLTGSVLIVSNPPGAELVVGGQVKGVTPLVLEHVKQGSYSGLLRMQGYAPHAVEWSVSDDRPIKVSADLNENVGRLQLTSTPAKARLWINGKAEGVTPRTIELTEGRYQVRLEQDGFVANEEGITIERKKTLQKHMKLQALPGAMAVNSEPAGGEVWLNGKKQGVTPYLQRDLTPGTYTVEIRKDGFETEKRTVVITSGSQDELNVKLGSSRGSVELYVRPAGVSVSIDGQFVGKVQSDAQSSHGTRPIKIEDLAPGIHQITLAHPRATPSSQTIQVKVEKGELVRPKRLDVWIANCELTYKDGRIETGALFSENDREIFFGLEPGVTIAISRDKLKEVKKLVIPEE